MPPSGLLWLLHQNPVCSPVLPMRATCPVQLISLIIFGQEYKLRSRDCLQSVGLGEDRSLERNGHGIMN